MNDRGQLVGSPLTDLRLLKTYDYFFLGCFESSMPAPIGIVDDLGESVECRFLAGHCLLTIGCTGSISDIRNAHLAATV